MIPFRCRPLALLVALACLSVGADPAPVGDRVRVCVVAIAATDQNDKVEPKLSCIAREVRKQEPALTGFRVLAVISRTVKVGEKEAFALVEGKEAAITAEYKCDKSHRVRLLLRVPAVGEITYTTACAKYFPVVTGHQTKAGDRLILAVMVRPCEEAKGK